MMFTYIHYTDDLKEGFGGASYGPYIRIRPKYKDDSGIHAHEQVHANQWWLWMAWGIVCACLLFKQGNFYWYYALLAGVGMHAVLYKFIPKYRLWCEVQAYKKQLGYYADDRKLLFAGFISRSYGLNISTESAYQLLKD